MKKSFLLIAALTASSMLATNCKEKSASSGNPAGAILATAADALSNAKSGKDAAAVVDTLIASAKKLKETSPDAFSDRTKYQAEDKRFIEVYGADAMVKYLADPDFQAANTRLMEFGGILH